MGAPADPVDVFPEVETVKRLLPKTLLKPLGPLFALLIATLTTAVCWSETSQPAPLSGSARPVIERFLAEQTAALPGQVLITIQTPQSGALPPCDAVEPFLPAGARLWGRVSVGVRCISAMPWTRYVPAYIAVMGNYYVAARPIIRGQAVTPADAEMRNGDLTTLPTSVIVDPAQLEGVKAWNSIALGLPLRQDSLRAPALVRQGQVVKVVARGTGFEVSTEGKAMSDAAVGAIVQVRMQGGQLLGGMLRPDGVVERSN